MEATEIEQSSGALPRSKRLKRDTNTVHQRLDDAIMACDPFASRARYGLFLSVQHGFHRDIDALYDDPALAAQVRQIAAIERDLGDLGLAKPIYLQAPVFDSDAPGDLPTALGALYVAEGSHLGAAFLLKEASAKLGLSTMFGARHLAGAHGGRGRHWRTFTAALDAARLPDEAEMRVTAGAKAMFERVSCLVRQILADR